MGEEVLLVHFLESRTIVQGVGKKKIQGKEAGGFAVASLSIEWNQRNHYPGKC